ncbi:MAG: 50S ribosomal protein L25/general stress protein Ctc [Bacteroidota bacterium]|jgi:large subunit ribosomal protein L25
MKSVSLSGSLRTNVGKVDAKATRLKGHVPCVIYGGKEQIHFHADERAFKPVIFTPNAHIVEINLDGKIYKTVLQEAQYHKINDKLIHADFLEIVDGKPVNANIPVVLTGQSEGVKKGGKLVLKLRKLKARGIAETLPDSIVIDISKLEIGDSISIGDLSIEGVTLLNAKNVSIVSVVTTRAVAPEPQSTSGAKPSATAAAPAKK